MLNITTQTKTMKYKSYSIPPNVEEMSLHLLAQEVKRCMHLFTHSFPFEILTEQTGFCAKSKTFLLITFFYYRVHTKQYSS